MSFNFLPLIVLDGPLPPVWDTWSMPEWEQSRWRRAGRKSWLGILGEEEGLFSLGRTAGKHRSRLEILQHFGIHSAALWCMVGWFIGFSSKGILIQHTLGKALPRAEWSPKESGKGIFQQNLLCRRLDRGIPHSNTTGQTPRLNSLHPTGDWPSCLGGCLASVVFSSFLEIAH